MRPALNPGWLLLVPALALLTGVLFIPLFASFWRSISDPEWTLDNYTKLLTDGVTLRVMGRTATSAAIVTVVAFLLGYPYAYLMTRVGPVARSVLLTIVLIPFWTSALARNFGWLVLIYSGGPVQTASVLSRLRRRHALRHRHRRHAGDEPGDAAVHGAAAVSARSAASTGACCWRPAVSARRRLSAFWKIYWPLSRAGRRRRA